MVCASDISLNGTPSGLFVDPKKLDTLHRPYQDFRRRTDAAGAWRNLPLAVAHQFRRYYFFNPPKWRVWARTLGSSQRMAPSFASIGAVRSGTSFLSSYILQHPHVVLPLSKEISFTETMRELMAHFPTLAAQGAAERRNGGAITGYCTPVMPNPLWIFLAQSMFPDMRIICVLRDPVERTFSHWRWDQKRFISRKSQDPHWKGFPDFETLIEDRKGDDTGRRDGAARVFGRARRLFAPQHLRALSASAVRAFWERQRFHRRCGGIFSRPAIDREARFTRFSAFP